MKKVGREVIGVILIVIGLIPGWIWIREDAKDAKQKTLPDYIIFTIACTSFGLPIAGSYFIAPPTSPVKSREGILGLLWTAMAGLGIWLLSFSGLLLLSELNKK